MSISSLLEYSSVPRSTGTDEVASRQLEACERGRIQVAKNGKKALLPAFKTGQKRLISVKTKIEGFKRGTLYLCTDDDPLYVCVCLCGSATAEIEAALKGSDPARCIEALSRLVAAQHQFNDNEDPRFLLLASVKNLIGDLVALGKHHAGKLVP